MAYPINEEDGDGDEGDGRVAVVAVVVATAFGGDSVELAVGSGGQEGGGGGSGGQEGGGGHDGEGGHVFAGSLARLSSSLRQSRWRSEGPILR